MPEIPPLRKIVHIYVVNKDGSGRLVAETGNLEDARIIGAAYEELAYKVLMDPPRYGVIQNVLSWTGYNPETSGKPYVDAVPWRDYLDEREKHERLSETFDALYEPYSSHSSTETYDCWRMRS